MGGRTCGLKDGWADGWIDAWMVGWTEARQKDRIDGWKGSWRTRVKAVEGGING